MDQLIEHPYIPEGFHLWNTPMQAWYTDLLYDLPGMNWVVIVLFCIIPMVAWAATLIAMKGYTLTGEKMKEIQAVNACRRDAVAGGMKLEEAMTKWQSMDQLPAEYRS